LDSNGNVDFEKIEARWGYLKDIKESLANKFFTSEVVSKGKTLPE
jgi:creatine kinase